MFGMKRREFITLLAGAGATWPVVALAQQPGMRRIGVLVGLAENDPEMKERLAGFRQGLEKLGWSEGSNVRIDYRFAPGGTQVHLLARELVALQPDVILAQSTPATAALKPETSTIPIVFAGVADPIGSGFVASLSRPSGNLTGLFGIPRGYHGQMAGYAQGDCTEPHARCSFGQSKNGGLRLLPAVCQNASSIARD